MPLLTRVLFRTKSNNTASCEKMDLLEWTEMKLDCVSVSQPCLRSVVTAVSPAILRMQGWLQINSGLKTETVHDGQTL